MEELSGLFFEKVNQLRTEAGLKILAFADNKIELKHAFTVEVPFDATVSESDDQFDKILSELEDIIVGGADLDSMLQEKKKLLLNKFATNMDVVIEKDGQNVSSKIILYARYFDLEDVGKCIDGDLVVQGTSLTDKFGPAFCAIEHSSDGLNYVDVGVVEPWKLIITPSGESSTGTKFVIPISIGPAFTSGYLRVKVFMDEVAKIPYDEETAGYDIFHASTLPCALSISTGFSSNNNNDEDNNNIAVKQAKSNDDETNADAELAYEEQQMKHQQQQQGSPLESGARSNSSFYEEEDEEELDGGNKLIVKDIKIASDYDDVLSLQSDGYELITAHCTPTGIQTDQEHLWRFHVLALYADPKTINQGVEDVMFIKCLKSLGTLPSVPLFEAMHDYDLSQADDDYSVYMAVKYGPKPHFRKLVMVSSLIENEDCLNAYVKSVDGVYRPAEVEIAKAVGGPCGILLLYNSLLKPKTTTTAATNKEETTATQPTSKVTIQAPGEGGRYLEERGSPGSSRDGSESEEEDEDFEDEEDIVAGLMQKLSELESEKMSLLNLNSELQKKAVSLMMREKAMQGQSAAARTASDIVATSEVPDVNTEQNQEKEKQYQDTLQLIVDERNKLNKQLKEFDQLALDLQTRLDDKEFKANGISSSFKQFKKEILMKAENSRTGHNIPKNQIKLFEQSEQKREEDLEKVRLRHISLRTTFKKLERTLRAREQLAEGLHMIDFEQLKIENQTLNEKIEERNEELAKLKRKKTTTVQVLTHIREKLRFVEQANSVVQEELSSLETKIMSLRNTVTSDKLERDAVRAENKELRAKQGFASSDLLLIDYEKRRNKVEQLKAATSELKDRYNIMMKQVNKANAIASRSNSAPWMMSESKM